MSLIKCDKCQGSGELYSLAGTKIKCPKCGGVGRLSLPIPSKEPPTTTKHEPENAQPKCKIADNTERKEKNAPKNRLSKQVDRQENTVL